uniref:Reverse transcriptase domain-containing protein n=1 Tax=Haemonchus contortus TaxID=6289 RepID=A0A7I4XT58_HAECO
MPRFRDSRTWRLLRNVPTQFQRLVKEVLSLRQKIVSVRQSIYFLRRCLDHRIVPNFISKKRLRDLLGSSKSDRKIFEIEMQLLRLALRTRRDHMFSMLKKCVSKEQCCARYLEDRLWKRIVGESKSICDSIRSKVKTTLQKKFDNLCSTSRNFKDGSSPTMTGRVPAEHTTSMTGQSDMRGSRVTVLGGFPLPDCARSLLELGPSFSPYQSISTFVLRRIICNLHDLQDRLRYKAKIDSGSLIPGPNTNALNVPFPRTYFKQQEPNVCSDVSFRIFADEVFKVLGTYQKQRMPSNISREQAYGLKLLQDLIKSRTIRLSVSDKGGEFVVIPRQLDVIITKHHLGDTSIYRPSSAKDFQTQCRRLNRVWMTTAKSAGLDHSLITQLKIESPCCSVLYLLIKTHKFAATDDSASIAPTSIKVRPIVSCVGGPTDRIGWFLNVILVQLLKYIPSHLTNIQMFLNKLQALQPNSACVMESFDVESLYTNVSNVSAMEAVLELLNQYQSMINMHGFSIDQVMSLLKECLSCNIFRWSGEYFEQIRGLAMGQRLAPILAIAFMSKIEAPVLEHRPMLYCRYIDDCFIVCSTQEQMDMYFDLLNTQSEHIRLTRERPSGSWLPFLNVQVRRHSGMLSTKWYRKPSNQRISSCIATRLILFRLSGPL